jgi:hypothetical protein
MSITGKSTVAHEILERLAAVKVDLFPLVKTDIEGLDSVQKGISFRVKDLKAAKHCFRNATDEKGRTAFYYNDREMSRGMIRELIRNAPHLIDMSFAATDGFGYREIRDMPLVPRRNPYSGVRMNANFNAAFFDDEQDYYYEVSSLHVALAEKICNVHIDKIGFVLRGPGGPFLSADFGHHAGDELGVKDKAAPYIGKFLAAVGNKLPLLRLNIDATLTGNWIARNVHLDLPSSRSGYRPSVGFAITPKPNLRISIKYTGKCGYCKRAEEEEIRIPVPSISDGRSITGGIRYDF